VATPPPIAEKPTSSAGVDVYVIENKIVEIRDRQLVFSAKINGRNRRRQGNFVTANSTARK